MKKDVFEEGKSYKMRSLDCLKKNFNVTYYDNDEWFSITTNFAKYDSITSMMCEHFGTTITAKGVHTDYNGVSCFQFYDWNFYPWMFEEFDIEQYKCGAPDTNEALTWINLYYNPSTRKYKTGRSVYMSYEEAESNINTDMKDYFYFNTIENAIEEA